MLTHFYHSVTRLRSLNLLVAASFAMLLGACSSTTSESRLVLNLPDWQKLHKETAAKQNKISSSAISDEAEIEFLSIKVSGSGLPQPLTELWKHKDGETPKMQASFVIPRGTSVLVQVLAVYGGNVSTEFYYGDNTVNADREIVGAEIKLELANVTSTLEGNVVGRYMDAPNHGPTGIFEYHFDPDMQPGGKPSMKITTGEIFGGWVKSFTLNSRLVQYKWPNGHFVFDPTDESQMFSGAQPLRSARIFIPHSFRVNGSDSEEQPAQLVTAGFFGPGASNEHLCLNPAGSNINELYLTAAGNAADQFKWSAHTAPSVDSDKTVRVNDPDLGGTDYVKGGDLNSTCAADSGGAEFTNYLKLDETQLSSSDSIFGFRGPFKKLASGAFLGKSFDSTNQRIVAAWSYLPGADADLGGVSVFWRRMPTTSFDDDDIRGDDGYACANFRSSKGFAIPFSEVSVDASSFSAFINGVVDEADANHIQVVACPRTKDGEFFESGISDQTGGGGGGSGPAPATKVVALGIDNLPAITAGTGKNIQSDVCSPIILQAKNASNQSAPVGTGAQLQVTAVDPSDKLYFDSACSTPSAPTNNLTMTDFWGRRVVYLKSVRASGSGSVTVSSSGGTPLTPATFYFTLVPKAGANRLVTIVKDDLFAYECADSLLVGMDSTTGAPAEISNLYLQVNNHDPLQKFHDPSANDCGSSPDTHYTFSNRVAFEKRFVYTGSGNSVTIEPVPSGSPFPNSGSVVAKTVAVTQPGAPAKVGFGLPQNMNTASCYRVSSKLRDGNFHATPNVFGTQLEIDASVTNGQFYSNPSCSGGGTSSVHLTILNGETQSFEPYYFRPSLPGSSILSLTGLNAYAAESPFTISVTAAPVHHFLINLSGEFYDGNGNRTPGYTAAAATSGTFTEVTIWALDSAGRQVTSFNGPVSSSNIQQIAGPVTASSLSGNFTGGVAYLYPMLSGFGNIQFKAGGNAAYPTYTYSNYLEVHAPLSIQLKTATSFSKDSCQPVLAQAFGTDNVVDSPQIRVPSAFNLAVVGSGSYTVYSTSNCQPGTETPQPPIAAGQSQKVFYVKGNAAGSSLLGVSYNSSPSWNFTWDTTVVGPATKLRLLGRNSLRKTFCAGFAVTLSDLNDNAVIAAAPTNLTPSTTVAGGTTTFYSNPDCTMALGPLQIPAGASTAEFYMKPMANDNMTGDLLVTSPGLTSDQLNFSAY